MQLFGLRQTYTALVVLAGLFAFRVLAELMGRLAASNWTASYSAWSSGTVDYRILLASQALVLFGMMYGVCRVDCLDWRRGYLLAIRIFASIYFAFMLFRFVVAVAGASTLYWFQFPLPAFFHLVIAAYLYCFARHLELNRLQSQVTI